MRIVLFIIAFLIPQVAGAAGPYWVDLTGTGTGAADGSDVDNLCAGLTDADCPEGGGDTTYLCNETTSVTFAAAGTSDAVRNIYNWTCPGGTAGGIDGGGTTDRCMTVTASHQYHVGPATITNCDEKGLWVDGALSNITFDDFETSYITGTASTGGIGDGTGWIIDNRESPGTTSAATNIVANRLVSHHNGATGYDTQTTGSDIVCNNCVFYNNGGLYAGGGWYAHPYNRTVTSGWTNVSGDVWAQDSLGTTDDVDAVYWVDGQQHLTEVSCAGAINLGEFCYSAGASGVGYLRINIGTDPATDEVQYRRGPLTNVVCNDCIAYDNENGEGDHGTGFQIDDMNTGTVLNRPLAYNNAGAGIKNYRSEDSVVNSPIVFGNGTDTANADGDRSGIMNTSSDAGTFNQVTANDNAKNGFNQGTGTGTCNNCTLTYNGDYGTRAVTGTVVLNNADIYGNTTGASTTVTGGTVTNNNGATDEPGYVGGTSPNTVNGFRLKASSPLIAAGTNLGPMQDYGNRRFGFPPDIGAWSYGSGDERGTVTTRTTVTPRTTVNARTTVTPR